VSGQFREDYYLIRLENHLESAKFVALDHCKHLRPRMFRADRDAQNSDPQYSYGHPIKSQLLRGGLIGHCQLIPGWGVCDLKVTIREFSFVVA
jgi:hypothetical protein